MAEVETAFQALLDAKSAYADDSSDENKAAKRDAAQELRYQRWLARNGPVDYDSRMAMREDVNQRLASVGLPPLDRPFTDKDLYDRWSEENAGGAE